MVVATTGFFDGVHLGHRKVIEQLTAVARNCGAPSAVVTFWPHPRNVLQQDAARLRLLTSLAEKKDMLYSLGVDQIHVLPFTREMSGMSAEEFVRKYLKEELGVDYLVVGYDHRLGCRSKDEPQCDILEIAARLGIKAERVKAVSDDYTTLSSTYIRNLLLNGQVEKAAGLLGYFYQMHGVVVSGRGVGRQIGFPTANIQLYEPLKLIPENGVYAVNVEIEGAHYRGICNIGYRPTFNDSAALTIETHILDFDRLIYGLDIRQEFVARIRNEQRFASVDELKAQLAKDKRTAAAIFEQKFACS